MPIGKALAQDAAEASGRENLPRVRAKRDTTRKAGNDRDRPKEDGWQRAKERPKAETVRRRKSEQHL